MCGRYRRTQKEEELARLYGIKIPPARDLPISWNVAPQQDVLAVRRNPESGERSLDALRIRMPMSRAALGAVLHETVRRNRVRDGIVYLQVTRGVAPRDFAFPVASTRPGIVVTARSLDLFRAVSSRRRFRSGSTPP